MTGSPLTLAPPDAICSSMPKTKTKAQSDDPELIKEWSLPVEATLGSAVRVKGILQEIRSRLAPAVRKSLDMQSGELTLVMPETSKTAFRATSSIVSESLQGIADLPIIPREIEDILGINSSEGSAGWRTGVFQALELEPSDFRAERGGLRSTYSTRGLSRTCSIVAPWTNGERRMRR